MPETIVSQYERAYNSPIETRRQVATATDRDNIPSGVRWRGMLVHVIADNATYELVGGIGNGDWQLMGGLQDAPIDGQTYGRKDGNWELIPDGGGGLTRSNIYLITTPISLTGTASDTTIFDFISEDILMDNIGDKLEMRFLFSYANASPNTFRLKAEFGGGAFSSSVYSNDAAGNFSVDGFVIKTGATTYNLFLQFLPDSDGYVYKFTIESINPENIRLYYDATSSVDLTLVCGYIDKII